VKGHQLGGPVMLCVENYSCSRWHFWVEFSCRQLGEMESPCNIVKCEIAWFMVKIPCIGSTEWQTFSSLMREGAHTTPSWSGRILQWQCDQAPWRIPLNFQRSPITLVEEGFVSIKCIRPTIIVLTVVTTIQLQISHLWDPQLHFSGRVMLLPNDPGTIQLFCMVVGTTIPLANFPGAYTSLHLPYIAICLLVCHLHM